MLQVPDAPWIREAETYGYPASDDPDPVCPVCGKECEDLYLAGGDVIGCENCLERVDAADWLYDHREEYEP